MFKVYSVSFITKLLGVNEDVFHQEIKPGIIKDFRKELYQHKIHNPDIGLDKDRHIYLVHPLNPMNYIETRVSIFQYI